LTLRLKSEDRNLFNLNVVVVMWIFFELMIVYVHLL